MTGSQYKNLMQWTVANATDEEKKNSILMTKAILKNYGASLPAGTCTDILLALMSEDYMGWQSCTASQAQQAANEGIPAIGINRYRIVAIVPDETATKMHNGLVISPQDMNELKQITEITKYERIDMQFFMLTSASTSTSSTTRKPIPHGNYSRYKANKLSVCTDGIGEDYEDKQDHQGHTAYMDGILDAFKHRYIVIPNNYPNYRDTLGCVGVVIDYTKYLFGVVGEGGPETDPNLSINYLREVSIKMVRDLGYETDGTYGPYNRDIEFIIFHDTKRNSWPSDTLNEDVAAVGRRYFY